MRLRAVPHGSLVSVTLEVCWETVNAHDGGRFLLSFSARTRRIRVGAGNEAPSTEGRVLLCARNLHTNQRPHHHRRHHRTQTHSPPSRLSPLPTHAGPFWPRADDRRSTDPFGAETQWQPPSAPTSCRRPRTTPAQATRRSGRRSTRSSPSGSSEATSRSSRRRATTRPTQS